MPRLVRLLLAASSVVVAGCVVAPPYAEPVYSGPAVYAEPETVFVEPHYYWHPAPYYEVEHRNVIVNEHHRDWDEHHYRRPDNDRPIQHARDDDHRRTSRRPQHEND